MTSLVGRSAVKKYTNSDVSAVLTRIPLPACAIFLPFQPDKFLMLCSRVVGNQRFSVCVAVVTGKPRYLYEKFFLVLGNQRGRIKIDVFTSDGHY
jgi:hypothetical protein